MMQLQEPPRHKRLFQKRFLLPGGLLLLTGGVIIWILNAVGLFQGPWSSILLMACDLASRHSDGLNRVGGRNHLADLFQVTEQRENARPMRSSGVRVLMG